MVKGIHKKNTFRAYAGLITVASGLGATLPVVALERSGTTDIQVNIEETLTLSVAAPDTWAQGEVNPETGSTLLRNKVAVSAASNSPAGFSTLMYSKTNTNLLNDDDGSSIIPTLASSTAAGAFPVNRWGYSINDTAAGDSSASYNAMSTGANPVVLSNATEPDAMAQDVFFGARADITQAAGTYLNTVVFQAIAKVVTPVNPVEPTPDTGPSNAPSGPSLAPSDRGSSVVAMLGDDGEDGDDEEDTNVRRGSVIHTYADPKGVTTTSNVEQGSSLATGLAVTSGVAAAFGIFFFIIARRKKDDGEEES